MNLVLLDGLEPPVSRLSVECFRPLSYSGRNCVLPEGFELAELMAPRPFMVERGHDDGVGMDEWISLEYAKVRRFYDKMGIPNYTTIEFFNGPHTIHGVGTFEFLRQHLMSTKGTSPGSSG